MAIMKLSITGPRGNVVKYRLNLDKAKWVPHTFMEHVVGIVNPDEMDNDDLDDLALKMVGYLYPLPQHGTISRARAAYVLKLMYDRGLTNGLTAEYHY